MFRFYLLLIFVIAIHGATVTTRENLEVPENNLVQLTCSYSGFSNTANVKWVFKDPNQDKNIVLYRFGPESGVDSGQGESLGWTANSDHTISHNSVSRYNSGRYTCMVEDGQKNFEMGETLLTVLVPPSKPTIISPKDHKLLIGQAGELVCESTEGSPDPTYTWYKYVNGNPLQLPFDARNDQKNFPNSSFTLTEDGTVKFLTVVDNDQGDYFCVAKNSAGEQQGEAQSISIGSVSVAKVVGIVFGVIFGVALLGLLGYILVVKLSGGDNGSEYNDSEVFEDGQADVMIGENYAMPPNKSNRQEQSLVV